MCPDCSSPALTSRGPGQLDLIIRGADDQMWMTSWASPAATFGPWWPLGGILSSSPASVTKARTTDRIDLVVVMPEERSIPAEKAYGPWWKEYTPYSAGHRYHSRRRFRLTARHRTFCVW